MFSHLKRLGTETAIYGISTILGRFLNFLLVPFYTNVLAPGEYGVVAYVYSIIAFVTVLYAYGMETAYFKYSSTREVGSERENFSTPFLSLLGTSIVFSALIVLLISPISRALALPEGQRSIVMYSAAILALDALAVIPFASLRIRHRPRTFAAIKIANIVVNVAMNVILLVVFRTGISGVFLSGLAASAVTILLLIPVILRQFTLSFHTRLWKALLRFGTPFVPAGLAAMVVQVIDRPILRSLTDDATVGIYQANYRLGIFMMLIVSMYDYAWRPFYFSLAAERNAKEIFARVLTYLVLGMAAVFLLVSFFVRDVVGISLFGHRLIHPSYWVGLDIVPVVLLGYAFLGVATNVSAGINIEKKTHLSPPINFLGAAVNIVANYLLIPVIGIMGAAWATALAYMVIAVATYILAQRVYPVKYELGRLAKIAVSAGAVFAIFQIAPAAYGLGGIVWKCGLFVVFVGLMAAMKFFERRELQALKRLVKREKDVRVVVEEPIQGPDVGA